MLRGFNKGLEAVHTQIRIHRKRVTAEHAVSEIGVGVGFSCRADVTALGVQNKWNVQTFYVGNELRQGNKPRNAHTLKKSHLRFISNHQILRRFDNISKIHGHAERNLSGVALENVGMGAGVQLGARVDAEANAGIVFDHAFVQTFAKGHSVTAE